MQISDAGLALIKINEGERARVYPDMAGYPTVGYGHKLLPGETFPNRITEAEASALLRKDVGWAESAVTREVKVPLTQGQFDALVDFTFNCGAGTLRRSTALRLLNLGQYAAVPAQLEKYDIAGGVICKHLEERRVAEVKLWGQA
jgi:lysozyme